MMTNFDRVASRVDIVLLSDFVNEVFLVVKNLEELTRDTLANGTSFVHDVQLVRLSLTMVIVSLMSSKDKLEEAGEMSKPDLIYYNKVVDTLSASMIGVCGVFDVASAFGTLAMITDARFFAGYWKETFEVLP